MIPVCKWNRRDALDHLLALIREAAKRPAQRRPTRPSFDERQRRPEAKGRWAAPKRTRSLRQPEEE